MRRWVVQIKPGSGINIVNLSIASKWCLLLITNNDSECIYWDFSGSIFNSLKCFLQESLPLIPIMFLTAAFSNSCAKFSIVQIVMLGWCAQGYLQGHWCVSAWWPSVCSGPSCRQTFVWGLHCWLSERQDSDPSHTSAPPSETSWPHSCSW
jgi:hypothetical protein